MAFIFNLVLLLFSLLLSLSCLMELIAFSSRPFGIYFFLYFLLWILCALGSGWSVFVTLKERSPRREWTFFENHRVRLLTVIFVLSGTVLAGYEYQARDIWADEIASMDNALEGPEASVRTSFQYHQPPMDQQLMLIGGVIFGPEEWTVRGPALLSLILFLLLFPLFIWSLTGSELIVGVISFAYLLNPYLIYYSVEGRPQQMTILFLMIYFYFLSSFLKENQKTNKFSLFVSATFLILSANVQGVTAMTALFLAATLVFTKKVKSRPTFFLANMGALMTYIPVAICVADAASEQNKVKNLDFSSILASYLSHWKVENLSIFFSGFHGLILPISSGILALFFLQRDCRGRKRSLTHLALTLVLVFFVLDIFNREVISWPFYYRYVVVYSLLVLIFTAMILSSLKRHLRRKQFIAVGTIFFLFIFLGRKFENFERLQNLRAYCTFSADFYKYLKQETTEQDYVLIFNLVPYGEWRRSDWLARSIYMPASKYPQLKSTNKEIQTSPNPEQIIPYDDLISGTETKNLILVSSSKFSEDFSQYWFRAGVPFEKIEFKDHRIYRFKLNKGKWLEDYRGLLQAFLDYKTDPLTMPFIYESIFYLAKNTANVEQMQRIYNRVLQYETQIPRLGEHSQKRAMIQWTKVSERMRNILLQASVR